MLNILILISCSPIVNDSNVDEINGNFNTRMNKIKTTDSKDIDLEYVETSSFKAENTKDKNKVSSNHIPKDLESVYNEEQTFVPSNKNEKVIDEQIEISSPPPVTTHPPVETTPTPTEESKELTPEPLCPNAWYDENQPCDWIHPNLKSTDELGRTVPTFSTSEGAWNWAEKQLFDETSTWYMCGFNLMDGHTNDGTNFFYGYMKACP